MSILKSRALNIQGYLMMLCAVFVAFSLLTATLAWLFQDRERQHTFSTTNFTFSADVYFLQSDNSHVSAQAYKDAQTGYYLVNISSASAINYAPKLHIDVKYKGLTRSYIRVYVNDMWLVSNKSIFKMDTVFNLAAGLWNDNRIYDKYYYYIGGTTEERGMVYSSTVNEEKTIGFISGIQDFARINNGTLYLEVRAEAVQINRMQAFWGRTQLP